MMASDDDVQIGIHGPIPQELKDIAFERSEADDAA
jgi:hypothetical protein